MASETLINYVNQAKELIATNGLTEDYFECVKQAARTAFYNEYDREYGLEVTGYLKNLINDMIKEGTGGGDFWELEKYCFKNEVSYEILNWFYEILLIEGQNKVFDSYLLYLEKNREPSERFYAPKRKHFLKVGVIQGFQDMLDDKLDILSISLPPGTGKTTIEKFFHSGVCGWYPKDYNLFFSHSADITRMYYDGVLSILQDPDYTWQEMFPMCEVTNTNAKMMQINIGHYKPFQNLMTASVGSEMAGKVRANRFLMVDDMIGKIEEALNKNTLDKLWNVYSTDARQRKVKGCKEIHISTRWSVHDIIGRLQRAYEGNERCRFIAVPDIDPKTGKSNFNYEFNGFDEQFFRDQELLMDEITYKCLFKNQPIEREGLLYHDDELRRYLDLPVGNPDAVLGVCDTKSKGTDFLVLPVMYQYGDDFYMVDCICTDSSDYGVQYNRMANLILEHNMQQCEFESNAGGDRVAFEVDKIVKANKGRCNITTKPTETNKETRIIVNADWIKKHVIFRDKELYTAKSDYGIFIDWLLCYSIAGKNSHDDIPDCLANFALYITNKQNFRRTNIISGGLI